MSRLRTTLRRVPLPLALLLAVAAALSLAWALSTPPLQGPDEADHVAYVARLAETGHVPLADSGRGTYSPQEAEALAGGPGFLRLLSDRNARAASLPAQVQAYRDFEDQQPPGSNGRGEGPLSTAKNPPLYYWYEAAAWRLTPGGHFFDRLFALRFFGLLALLAMVTFAWLLAGEAFGRRRLPQTVTAGVVALLPMDGFMSGVVNSDILLATVFAAFSWLALRTVRLGLDWRRAAGLTLVAVLAVLTHGRGLAIVPALGVTLVVAWIAHRAPLRETLRAGLTAGGVAIAGFLVLQASRGANSGTGGSVYGGEVTLGKSGAFKIGDLLGNIWQFYFPRLGFMTPRPGPGYGYRQMVVEQYLGGVFASYDVYYPPWVYDRVQLVVALLLGALAVAAIVRWRAVLAAWPRVVVLVAIGGSVILLLHVVSYRALVGTGGASPLLTGRYALPLTPLVGVSVAAIVAALPRRVAPVLAALVVLALLCLSIGGLSLNVQRFYA